MEREVSEMFCSASGKDLPDDVPVDVRQAAIDAVVRVCELFVVQAEEVEDGRVEVVNRPYVLHCLVAELVGRAKADASLTAISSLSFGTRRSSTSCPR